MVETGLGFVVTTDYNKLIELFKRKEEEEKLLKENKKKLRKKQQ